MARDLRPRSEMPVARTWDTASVFASEDDFEAAVAEIESSLPSVEEFQGHLGDSSETLADWFAITERLGRLNGRVSTYVMMFAAVDTNDQQAAARRDRARSLASKLAAATSFAEPEMAAIGFPKLRDWVASNQRLSHLGYHFHRLERRSAHIRSDEVENLLSSAAEALSAPENLHSILANSELDIKPAVASDGSMRPIGQANYHGVIAERDRELRRTCWQNYADAHLGVQRTMAAAIAGGVKRDVLMMRARRFSSSLEAALDRNAIPTDVFHNTLAAFRNSIPTWHRYWRARRRALRLDDLRPWDVRGPMTSKHVSTSIEQDVVWVTSGLAPLGKEYVSTMRRGALEDRWVDVYPNVGKRMGAYSSGSFDTKPFIFMAFNDDVYGLGTVAHEMGHSMHSWYTRRSQPYVYAGYGMFAAEVASNLNQALVRHHLLTTETDLDIRFTVLEEAMANFYRYLFIMPALSQLELEMHERVERGGAITAEWLTGRMTELLSEVYGGELVIEGADRDRAGVTWATFHTHLYSNFYCFQYTTGIAGANALAEGILAGKSGAVDRYLTFLKSGGSNDPIELLRAAGVDLESSAPVEKAYEVFASYVEKLEALVEERDAVTTS